jgi:ribosome assembly protein YihI (activator of Der GTPase)
VEFFTYKPYGVKRLVKVWSKIEKKMEGASESEYKLAVIEADNILNDLLKKIGYAGQTLGEKLEKITSATISNIDELLEAHKTRNNIVHDPDYKLSLDEAKKILEIYKVALKSLEAL